MSSSDKTYYSQVDGLRCIAIVAVMLEHFIYIGVSKLYVGFFGVDLFFVLSGFLITEILLNQKGTKPSRVLFKNFYIRRSLRIFPIYYLMCVFFLIALPGFKPVASCAFLYVLNWAQFFTTAPVPNHVSHFWSLAIEEQFYLLWPFIIILVPNRFLLKVFIVIIIGRFSYGIYVYHKLVGFTFNKYVFSPWWNKIDFSFFPVLKYHAYLFRFPEVVLLSILVATLSYKYFELPLLRLKSKFV